MNFKLIYKKAIYRFRIILISRLILFFKIYLNLFWQRKSFQDKLLNKFFSQNSNSYIVQIGANDGFVHDSLYKFIKKYHLKGLVIEPQKTPFNVLKKIYRNDKISIVNAAIDKTDGYKTLYKLSFSNDRWASGLSSFSQQQLENCINNGLVEKKAKKYHIRLPENKADWITGEMVQTICFDTLFLKEKLEKINLLMTDTEGYDFEIIKMFDFNRFRPEIIIFEKTHLSETDYSLCKTMLSELGYALYEENANAIAIHVKSNIDNV